MNPFAEDQDDPRGPTIADREDEYRARCMMLVISPERIDPFAEGKSVSFSPTLFTIRINNVLHFMMLG